jgi:hypothetical protein
VVFAFQTMDIIADPPGFDLAADLVFIATACVMLPVVLTGWRTWKNSYKGARIMLFQRKIAVAWAMLAVAVPEAVWRTWMLLNGVKDTFVYDLIFYAGIGLLVAGAVVEGYYGGRLNHR